MTRGIGFEQGLHKISFKKKFFSIRGSQISNGWEPLIYLDQYFQKSNPYGPQTTRTRWKPTTYLLGFLTILY